MFASCEAAVAQLRGALPNICAAGARLFCGATHSRHRCCWKMKRSAPGRPPGAVFVVSASEGVAALEQAAGDGPDLAVGEIDVRDLALGAVFVDQLQVPAAAGNPGQSIGLAGVDRAVLAELVRSPLLGLCRRDIELMDVVVGLVDDFELFGESLGGGGGEQRDSKKAGEHDVPVLRGIQKQSRRLAA